ncbi:hypothetical protein [Peribacillus frigoritolerans]|uniref:hypothetical protein n=1 Tax=Peribacillus frigoritolerans TaxID=450367 RepID=UPI0022312A51|nr:hypothetical protein [Peribacillus frigoritolerans]UZD44898.1 hypothetical protein OMJ04_14665 [Peribacillus frigoritolerans]
MDLHHHNTFDLFLGEEYDCWQDRAGGSTGHFTYNFIVSPPLPDDISNMDLVFKEYSDPFKENSTGLDKHRVLYFNKGVALAVLFSDEIKGEHSCKGMI